MTPQKSEAHSQGFVETLIKEIGATDEVIPAKPPSHTIPVHV